MYIGAVEDDILCWIKHGFLVVHPIICQKFSRLSLVGSYDHRPLFGLCQTADEMALLTIDAAGYLYRHPAALNAFSGSAVGV